MLVGGEPRPDWPVLATHRGARRGAGRRRGRRECRRLPVPRGRTSRYASWAAAGAARRRRGLPALPAEVRRGMCFSPEADLVTGIVVSGVGIDALRHVPAAPLPAPGPPPPAPRPAPGGGGLRLVGDGGRPAPPGGGHRRLDLPGGGLPGAAAPGARRRSSRRRPIAGAGPASSPSSSSAPGWRPRCSPACSTAGPGARWPAATSPTTPGSPTAATCCPSTWPRCAPRCCCRAAAACCSSGWPTWWWWRCSAGCWPGASSRSGACGPRSTSVVVDLEVRAAARREVRVPSVAPG